MKRYITGVLSFILIILSCGCDSIGKEDQFYNFANSLDAVIEEFEKDELENLPYSLSVDKKASTGQYTVELSTYSDSKLSAWAEGQMSGSGFSGNKYQLGIAILRNSIVKKEAGSQILGKLRMKFTSIIEQYQEHGFAIKYKFSTADGDNYVITEQDMEQALYNAALS